MAMRICPKCGESNGANADKCFRCGESLVKKPEKEPITEVSSHFKKCVKCKMISSMMHNECPECGGRLEIMVETVPIKLPRYVKVCGRCKIFVDAGHRECPECHGFLQKYRKNFELLSYLLLIGAVHFIRYIVEGVIWVLSRLLS